MGKVLHLKMVSRLDLPPDKVLESAVGKLDTVVIIGWEKESGDHYFASSAADGGDVLWLMEHAKKCLLEIGEG